MDLAPAQRLINFLQPSNSSSDTTRNQQRQQQQQGWDCQLQQQQQQFMLHVAFRVGRGVNSHTAPELQLQLPLWAAQQLPPLPLPGWDPQSSLVEYVPHLAERLAKHLQDHCPAAALRWAACTAPVVCPSWLLSFMCVVRLCWCEHLHTSLTWPEKGFKWVFSRLVLGG